ncbi:MAG: hypothetical protein QGI49_11440 [SAR202 cluster bacterium]|jgi:hypothetical protein|nr:hypothetical protein [SAR202 cluster bacterium]
MTTEMRRTGTRTVAGALIAAGPVIAACSLGPSYDEWAATDGAAGRINLEEVQNAFKDADSVTEFERRVNEIYEGDGLILVRARQDPDALVLEGWEDLSGNFEIDEATDDKLFDIVEREKQHQMRGYGSNGYYNRGFGGGDFLFTYLVISSMSNRGYYYSTPPTYARGGLQSSRNSYRSSNGYKSQVSKNSKYFKSNGGYAASAYNSAGSRQSTARQSYKSKQQTSGAFKSSSTGVRSRWGSSSTRSSSSRGGRGGGFRGFGGSQTIVGPTRPGYRS